MTNPTENMSLCSLADLEFLGFFQLSLIAVFWDAYPQEQKKAVHISSCFWNNILL